MAKDWNTFFQTSIYICILIIILTMAINFINTLDLFLDVESGYAVSGKEPNNIFADITGFSGGFEFIWISLLTVAGLGALVVAKLTHSTNMIGVWLFSGVFWTSYNKCISVVNISSGGEAWIAPEFLLMFTVALLFLWAAAIIGMLTGSG